MQKPMAAWQYRIFAFPVNADMQGTRVGMPVGADSLTEFVNGCIDELQEAGQLEAWYQSAVEYAESLGLSRDGGMERYGSSWGATEENF